MPFDTTTGFRERTEQELEDIRVLRRVRDEISKPNAWIKESMGLADNEQHCIEGWLREVTGEWNDHRIVSYISAQYIEPLIRGNRRRPECPYNALQRVIRFNDHQRTKQITVTRLMDRAIARAVGE